jgi:putative tricarboxylic transport membrane protein
MSRSVVQGLRSLACLALALLAGWAPAAADWKPDKRVEIVVTTGAGGGNDRIARLVHKIMLERKFVDAVATVVNKPGGGQVLGLTYLNQHAGDGHYVAINSVSFLANYVTGRSPIGLDDVVPIALLFSEYVGFAVRPDSDIKTAKDLMARLAADAGSVSTAISGAIGNHNYVALGSVVRAVGGDLKKLKVAVFVSGQESITALLGGHVDMVVAPAATALPHMQAGRMRMIAIAAPRRLEAALAEVPTWSELGANVVVDNWRIMLGARGMTAAQSAYWEGVFAKVVDTDEWRTMLERGVLSNDFRRGAEVRAYLDKQHEELRAVLGAFGLVK